jgi:hypothetical protein
MPKQITTATMEGTKEKGKPCKRWRVEVDEDLNIMGINNRRTVVKDCQEWRKMVLETEIHNGLQCLRRRRRRRICRNVPLGIHC